MTNQSKSAAGPGKVAAALKNNIGNSSGYVGINIAINAAIVNVALLALATSRQVEVIIERLAADGLIVVEAKAGRVMVEPAGGAR